MRLKGARMDTNCKWCGRHLNIKNVQVFVGEVVCPNSKCKGGTFVNIQSNNPYMIMKQIVPETLPKDKRDKEENEA